MYTFLILLLTIWHAQAVSLTQSLISETGSGYLDQNGVCYCTINLPDTTFPFDRFERLEIENRNLSITVEKEITKVYIYQSTLTVYIEQMKNLTKRVEIMENGGLSYTELEFELIKLEIKEMETLILQLKVSFNGSNVIIETLYQEIRNISIMVNQLQIYDKNNVLVIRREIESLKKRLEDCENNTKPDYPYLPPPAYGICDHGHIVNISKPYAVRQNINGASYKWGGWGKDSLLGADQSHFWVSPLSTDGRTMNYVYHYASYNDFVLYKQTGSMGLSNYGQGGGMIMYNNTMYYNCHNSNNLCKHNMKTNVVERRALRDATCNNRFSYASTPWQDIDLAADEEGLWVIYATEHKGGNIIISKLDATTLDVKQSWSTSLYKPGVTNAFMVCGVLYATRIYRTKMEEIFYMYDTKTGKEGHLSIPIEKMMDTMHSLSYNPNDHKLYMYSDGFLFTYYASFMPKKK